MARRLGSDVRLGDTALDARRRERELEEVSAPGYVADLVVVGGGITGVGVALDAAARGLDTVLMESHDLAFGTSRWSSKLAHGGLRYLASGDVGIARRSARERHLLLTRTAPHLTRPLAQVVPVLRDASAAHTLLPALGFVAGDVLARTAGTGRAQLPSPGLLDVDAVAGFVPGVDRSAVRRGYVNWDCQLVDDARLVTAVARTAAGFGARVLTRMRVDSAGGNRVSAVDTRTGQGVEVRARAVVNATGVWADRLAGEIRIRPSRGTHLVVDAAAVGHPTGALTVPIPGETNRFCMVLPEEFGRVFIGLTDVDAPGPVPDVPVAEPEEIDFLLEVVNRALARRLTRDDVLATYSGLRPLLDAGPCGSTADLSRSHSVSTSGTGLLTVTGGKLTEYRLMAEQAVDAAVAASGLPAGPCRTREIPLVGAPGPGSGAAALPAALTARYGAESEQVVAASRLDRPLDPVAPGLDVTRAEFSFAVTHEGALEVSDIVDRRSRVGLVPADRAAALDCADEALRAARG